MAKWTSNTPAVLAALREGNRRGLLAAAMVYKNRVKRDLAGGYTSGDFVTGTSVNHVTNTLPIVTPAGGRIVVGTNLMYNLYWELGHHNLFTGHYERVRIWVPALVEERLAMLSAFAIQMQASLAAVPPL
jgi:hypothetical protein